MSKGNRRDDGADLPVELSRAVAGPPADPEFRGELRRRLVASHQEARAAGSAHVRTSSRPRPSLRLRWLRPVAVLVAATVVTAVVLVPRLGLGPWRVAEFGALPGLTVADKPSNGGAGGPGFTFQLDYALGGVLAAGWPNLPGRALAFRLQPTGFSETRARELATALGITAPVVQEGWHGGYLWAADPGDGGPALRLFPDGYTYFSRPYDFGPRGRDRLPESERAVGVARDWLVASGFVPPGALGTGRVSEDLQNGTILVKFGPADPADVVTVYPFAVVQVGEGEKVVMGSAAWFPTEATSPYPLRSVAEAWESVKSGRGVLGWTVTEYPGPSSDSGVVAGPATIDRVRVAWAITFAADKTPFFVPVYVFSGQAEVAGAEGPVTLPVEVWAPAVRLTLGGP